jgi:hypothetical protein
MEKAVRMLVELTDQEAAGSPEELTTSSGKLTAHAAAERFKILEEMAQDTLSSFLVMPPPLMVKGCQGGLIGPIVHA